MWLIKIQNVKLKFVNVLVANVDARRVRDLKRLEVTDADPFQPVEF